MMGIALIACLLMVGCTAEAKEKTVWQTAPFAEQCREFKSGNVYAGQDFIFRRCEGAALHWLLYQEGTRLSVGFGTEPHVSLQGLSTERGNWPLQWGGTISKGRFAPLVAIIRFRKAEETKSTLFVFRLLPNGSSCVVGEVAAGSDQSAKAKQLAERAMTTWQCLTEPVRVTS
jgi:hypothetical protein